MELQAVIDTNVLYAGLRSRQGASHRLLREIGRNSRFQIHLSVPLVLEYEEVTKRNAHSLSLTDQDIDDVLDYLCSVGKRHEIHYLWRPFLVDADDDMILELAVESRCDRIVTFNQRDFQTVGVFDVKAVSPQEFLREIDTWP